MLESNYSSIEPIGFSIFFTSLYIIIPLVLSNVFNGFNIKLSFASKVEWTNRLVSTISSITAFTLSLISIINQKEWVTNVSTSTCTSSFFILKFISFYFLFDSLHIFFYRKQLYDLTTLIHHLLIGVSSYVLIGLYYKNIHLILLYFLLFEITNPFIHMRWFLKNLNIDNHLYLINGILMSIGFIFVRDLYVPYHTISLYLQSYKDLTTLSNFFILLSFPLITFLNLYWTFLIVKGITKHLFIVKKSNIK